LGYISKGDIVPEVITTLLNRSKTGLMARDGSRHLMLTSEHKPVQEYATYVKWNIGFGTVAFSVSNGSNISKKPKNKGVSWCAVGMNVGRPFSYVATSVAKLATFCNE
jgi:hypothetical protein